MDALHVATIRYAPSFATVINIRGTQGILRAFELSYVGGNASSLPSDRGFLDQYDFDDIIRVNIWPYLRTQRGVDTKSDSLGRSGLLDLM
jgi:hypothetical protein